MPAQAFYPIFREGVRRKGEPMFSRSSIQWLSGMEKAGCGVEPAYREVIRSALLFSDGWASLLLGQVQAFDYENCASD